MQTYQAPTHTAHYPGNGGVTFYKWTTTGGANSDPISALDEATATTGVLATPCAQQSGDNYK